MRLAADPAERIRSRRDRRIPDAAIMSPTAANGYAICSRRRKLL
jgi:hypothetical protein